MRPKSAIHRPQCERERQLVRELQLQREIWASYIGFMKVCAALILVSFSLAACGPVDQRLTINGQKYLFPAEHDADALPDEDRSRGVFARVRPPREAFLLIYSDDIGEANAQRGDVPTVFRVNGHSSDVKVTQVGEYKVVCRSGEPEIFFRCGIQVVDTDVLWSVVFNRDQVANAASISAKASAYLASYRQHALQPEH